MHHINYNAISNGCIFCLFMIFIIKYFLFEMRRRTINEEITKAEVRSMITSAISDALKEKDFEKRVREVTSDAMEKFFRMMYNKRNFWKGELKNVQ